MKVVGIEITHLMSIHIFKQNMDLLGLPAPENLFGTLSLALASATTILTQVDKFGKAVTVGELIGAGTVLEGLAVVGACSAAYYVGAVIGSIAVATGQSVSGGVTIADVIITANRYKINRPWIVDVIARRY